MTEQRPAFTAFRERLLTRQRMLGTFLKLPTTQVVEILGAIGYDFVVIDQEHAALGRDITDLMILAARASNIAPVVRIAEFSEANILSALDSGAMGIMVPHVSTVEKARAIARSCRYAGGSRGFAGLTRASNWGRIDAEHHMSLQDSRVACIAMIEDFEAVDLTADIARVDGIDALFIGRGDLTAAHRGDPHAGAKVAELSRQIAAAARAADIPLMMLPTSKADFDFAAELGARAMLVSSDHGFIRSAAAAALREYSA
ncbi:aldolase/citrate lyase family protein [Neorhizobium galegae]|uniref:HpcH/HpaI aldolase family protein n=1 Tax=Neorhizobium galegae TaxID=399 RepID=UPI0006225F63|nr:aldolase/citrate lyase family protein [Neorhizobium galegae]MCQ1767841.1 aldolase/citrate lyase family protein [Neorhizobium galegae]MCQ1848180.1 aldolase/citrate lyase family protein [Neorhizobium galegae]CDZ26872.1 2-keto-3-deoxy-L-rhamnonate aldolase [Neorhizobium galegae bv. officinalis]CDZ37009.1 2-keto-3-deoxy-L-rhamnonate aldolase [Neorhizobium galegae bv. officinalis]